jgi:hypothetical protein
VKHSLFVEQSVQPFGHEGHNEIKHAKRPKHSNISTITNIKLGITIKMAQLYLINMKFGPVIAPKVNYHFGCIFKIQIHTHHVSAHQLSLKRTSISFISYTKEIVHKLSFFLSPNILRFVLLLNVTAVTGLQRPLADKSGNNSKNHPHIYILLAPT